MLSSLMSNVIGDVAGFGSVRRNWHNLVGVSSSCLTTEDSRLR